MGELLLANEGEDPNIITFHIPWGQCHISLLSQLFLPFFSRLGNWEFLPFFRHRGYWEDPGVTTFPILGVCTVTCGALNFQSGCLIRSYKNRLPCCKLFLTKCSRKFLAKCFLVETGGLCLFSLHICIAACLTFQWRGCYTCFLPN